MMLILDALPGFLLLYLLSFVAPGMHKLLHIYMLLLKQVVRPLQLSLAIRVLPGSVVFSLY